MGQSVTSRQLPVTSQKFSLARPGNSFLLETGDWRPETETRRVPVDLTLAPGRVLGLVGSLGSGLTSIGVGLIAAATTKEQVAILDAGGWFCPSLAWEAGIDPERLTIVRCSDRTIWPEVAAALMEGFAVLYAEVPHRIPDQALRRLAALARSRRSGVVLRAASGDLPASLVHLRLEGVGVDWEGTDAGHGLIRRRVVALKASGKGARGIERYLEMESDGANPLRPVSGLAIAPPGRAAG